MSEDDLPRDAHLRASLRHAPDASIGPSASLSGAILAEARAKARTPGVAPAARRHPLLALWDALTQPAVGTAVAGLTVATVVGLMWWQGPGDEALPARAPAPQSAPAPASEAPLQQATSVDTPPPAPAAVPSVARKEAPKKEEKEEKVEAGIAVEKQHRAPVAARPPAPTPAPEPAPAAPPAAVAAAPAPLEEKASADSATAARARAETATLADEARASAAAAANARSKSVQAESERRSNRAFMEPAAPDLARMRATVAAEPSRWTWRPAGDNEARPADAALNDWLGKVDTATRGTWRRVAASDTPPTRTLQLMQDGRVRHLLQLEGERITWLADDGNAWQALLPPSLQEGPAR